MSITQIQIALDLDEDASPSFLDGKLRITAEEGHVSIHVDREKDGCAYVLAECSRDDFLKALKLLGLVE